MKGIDPKMQTASSSTPLPLKIDTLGHYPKLHVPGRRMRMYRPAAPAARPHARRLRERCGS